MCVCVGGGLALVGKKKGEVFQVERAGMGREGRGRGRGGDGEEGDGRGGNVPRTPRCRLFSVHERPQATSSTSRTSGMLGLYTIIL